jgi:hypothetical protein
LLAPGRPLPLANPLSAETAFVDFSRENWTALYERLDELEWIKCWQTTPDPDLPEYGLCYDF